MKDVRKVPDYYEPGTRPFLQETGRAIKNACDSCAAPSAIITGVATLWLATVTWLMSKDNKDLILANVKLASSNRSIIFVNTTMHNRQPTTGGGGIPRDKIAFYQAQLSFTVSNRGSVPAALRSVHVDLYMGRKWTDDAPDIKQPDSVSLLGQLTVISCFTPGLLIVRNDNYLGSNFLVDAHSASGECKANFFYQRPDGESSWRGETDAEKGFISPRPFWAHVVVKYTDITGTDGETSIFVEHRGALSTPLEIGDLNYWK